MKTRTFLKPLGIVALLFGLSSAPGFAAPNATVPGTYLEDFARTTVLAPSTGITLSDGITLIYWNAFGKGTFTIQDSILIAKCDSFAYYRFATSSSKRFAYCIFRVKGDARAKNNLIYTRIAAQGPADSGGISDNYNTSERLMDTLVGPDSLPVPAITTQFQTIVVDMKKNGLSFGLGANAFQFGTHAPMELDFDYIFMSNSNPLDSNSSVINSAAGKSNANAQAIVTFSQTGKSLKIKTNLLASNSKLALYNLQGKMIRTFDIHGTNSVISLSSGNLKTNMFLYTVNGPSGAILAKGKISLQ